MNRLSLHLAWTLCAALCAGSLWGYTRSESAGTYAERTGPGIPLRFDDFLTDTLDNPVSVPLPFDFGFYGRQYRQIYVNPHGRICFANASTTYYSAESLAVSPAPAAARNMIHGLATDTRTHFYYQGKAVLSVHYETGRVVVQWKKASPTSGAPYDSISHQIHLRSNGVIELHFGSWVAPVAALSADLNFVSGIVDPAGTEAYAGYGNTLALQTTRPASGTVVTFTPPAFMFPGGIEMTANETNLPQMLTAGAAAAVPVASFTLHQRGAGGTVTALDMQVPDTSDIGATWSLYEDTAPFGAFNGETLIATGTHTTGNVAFTALSLDITGGNRHYLVTCLLTAVNNWVPGYTMRASITSGATTWGWYVNPTVRFSTGAGGGVFVSSGVLTRSLIKPGETDVPALSVEVRRDPAVNGYTLTAIVLNFNVGGDLTLTDLVNLKLWQDNGTEGVLDGSDNLLGTVAVAGGMGTTFSPLNIVVNAAVNLLLTVNIDATFQGGGWFEAEIVDGTSTPATLDMMFGGGGSPRRIGVLGATTLQAGAVRALADGVLLEWPAVAGDTNLPGLLFGFDLNTGTADLTSLTFAEVQGVTTTGITNMRLYRDTGTRPGRLDAGDQLVTTTPTVNSDNVVLAITGLTLSTAQVRLLMVFDTTAARTSDIQWAITNVVTAPVITSGFSLPDPVTGTLFATRPTPLATDGIDIVINSLNSGSVTVTPGSHQVLGRFTATARGAGGSLPSAAFLLVDAMGGVNQEYGLVLETWLEGAGPLGSLDASDTPLSWGPSDITSIALGDALDSGSASFLVTLGRLPGMYPVGPSKVQFAGFQGGTAVRVVGGLPDFAQISASASAGTTGGGGGGDDDDGGCAARQGSRAGMGLLLLALLGAMGCAVGSRRRKA